ncbi:integrase/recombinase, partial [Fusobacterium animalis ATCC 51191]
MEIKYNSRKNMEIKKIDEKNLVVSQRKKRNRDTKKTIFEIYKSEKTVKDYMFH